MKSPLILIWLALAATAGAQPFAMTAYKIAGGGGVSTNGQFAVRGVIGQHDASGAMTNGQFSTAGGFLALPQVVQVAGAPTLKVTPGTPGNAVISWTPNTAGFVLQETASLASGNWVNSPSGATNPVTVSVTLPVKFYRLSKP